jgi:hypothetical protein
MDRPDAAGRGAASVEHAASRINMVQLIQLRWIAVVGQISTIAFVTTVLRIPLPLAPMLMVLTCLIAFNLGSQLRWHEGSPVSNRQLFLALLVDVAGLTALLYFSGGASTPFAFLYLLQVILSALLLEVWSTWIIVVLTSASRPVLAFDYRNGLVQDLPVAFDSTLKQMLFNVLDNALEASPHWLSLEAERDGDTLVLSVADAGPGFAPGMLENFGKPYQSTKRQPGHGLGLFLVVNVSRTLGGTVAASNLPQGGALVRLTLPLAAVTLGEGKDHAS